MTTEESVTQTVGFLLGKLGRHAHARFADRLAHLALRPRHCAVLELLSTGPRAQLDLAKATGVTPSVIVNILDELQEVDAVRRVRDTGDRRRQLVELTSRGRELQRLALSLAQENDRELLRTIGAADVETLREALGRVAEAAGLATR